MTKLKYIDSLRGIAILLVIMHHSHPYFAGISNSHLPAFIDLVLQNGDKGVTLFFVISAFTLSLSMDNRVKIGGNVVINYFIRRFFRIAPLYYLIILVILLLKVREPSLGSILANFSLIHGANPYWINSTVPGGWSVGVEVMFYLLFPLFFFNIKTGASAINVTLIAIIAAKIITSIMFKNVQVGLKDSWGVFVYENIISQLPVFLIGLCLFHLQQVPVDFKPSIKSLKTAGFFAVLIFAHLLVGNVFKEHYVYAIAFAFLAYSLSGYQPKILVNRVTTTIGKWSYSLYLIHLVVANLLVKFHFTHYCDNPVYEVVIRFFIILIISSAFAVLSYKYIETPFQYFGRMLIKRVSTKHIPL